MLVSCQDCDTYVWGVSLIVVTETNPTKIKEEGGEKLLRTWPVHVVSKAFFISNQIILTYLWLWLSCGRAVAFDTRGLQFKILYWTLIYSQWQLYWKTKTKYKIGREWPFLKKQKVNFCRDFSSILAFCAVINQLEHDQEKKFPKLKRRGDGTPTPSSHLVRVYSLLYEFPS